MKRLRKRREKKTKRNFKVRNYAHIGGLGLLAFLIIANIIVAISTSTKSVEVVELERKIEDIKAETSIIKGKIVSESSLKELAENTEELGLKKANNFIYLNTQDYYAKLK